MKIKDFITNEKGQPSMDLWIATTIAIAFVFYLSGRSAAFAGGDSSALLGFMLLMISGVCALWGVLLHDRLKRTF